MPIRRSTDLRGVRPLAVLMAMAVACIGSNAMAADCMDTAMTQGDMTACAGAKAADADKQLNAAYKDILRYVQGAERAKLVAAQRAWLKFRDADCAFWGDGGGSIGPMNRAHCLARLSLARTEELKSWPPNADRSAIAPNP